jgi:Flp pilus assembly pilin Flp
VNKLLIPDLPKFFQEENGAASVEYAILVALVATAIFVSTFAFDITVIYSTVSNSVLGLIASAAN